MSQFQLPNRTRKRLPKIIAGLLAGKTHDEIAKDCSLKNRKTIQRDIELWAQSGGLEKWLQQEWMKIHGKIADEDPKEAYRQLTKLLSKTLTQRVKAEVEGGMITVKMWQPPKEDKDSAASSK